MKNILNINFQLLVIPSDNTDPVNIRLSSKKIRILTAIALALIIHFVVGFVFYVRFVYVHNENKKLIATNELLKEDNQRIYQLEDTFAKIEESNRNIRNALGIGGDDSTAIVGYPDRPIEKRLDTAIPAFMSRTNVRQPDNLDLNSDLDFIKMIASPYHNFLPSIPTLLPVDGLLTSDYEDISIGGDPHQGVDLAAQRGSIVRASGDGVVMFSNWTHDLGNLVIIYHGNDFFSFYGHNQIILKHRRSLVRKGDPIALVGSTGRSSNPHLHFEIWKNGEPIDPKSVILSLRNSSRS